MDCWRLQLKQKFRSIYSIYKKLKNTIFVVFVLSFSTLEKDNTPLKYCEKINVFFNFLYNLQHINTLTHTFFIYRYSKSIVLALTWSHRSHLRELRVTRAMWHFSNLLGLIKNTHWWGRKDLLLGLLQMKYKGELFKYYPIKRLSISSFDVMIII